jgi:hypothetical protein
VLLAALTLAASGAVPHPAWALRTHERPNWMIGLGIGYGRGTFDGLAGTNATYRDGAAPQIEFGRQLGQHFNLGLEYEGWMAEFGGVQDTVGVKFRRSLQNFALAATFFPGRPHDATGGIWIRLTTGIGWAGTAVLTVHEDEAQHNAPRLDEWGVGFSGSAGYEFRIAPDYAAGLGVTFAGFDIGERVVDRGGFAALVLNLRIYF